MTATTRRPPTRRPPAPSADRADALRGSVGSRLRGGVMAVLAGVLAGVVGWLLVAVPVGVVWLADPLSSVSLGQALGVSADVWALAHHGVVDTPAFSIRLTPLLLTALCVLLVRYAARQVLSGDRATDPPVTIGGAAGAWRALRATELLVFAGGYVTCGVLLALLAGLGQAPVPIHTLLPGLVLVPLAGVALALLREHHRQEQPTIDTALSWVTARTPVLVRRGLAPAGEALAGVLVAALLVVVALVIVRMDRVATLTSALDTGGPGLAVLVVAQVLLLPNLVLWALGWLTGAGLTVGPVAIDWAGTTSGDLPLVPVLAVLPEPGPLPELTWLVGLVPVLAGVWIGVRAVRGAARLSSWWAKAQVALSACLWVGLAVLVLSWLATGGLSPGLLGTIGVTSWLVTGLLVAELGVGALLVVTVLHLTRRGLRAGR